MTPTHSHKPQRQLTGDLAVWLFIMAELTVFAIFFTGYSWMKIKNPELFSAGQHSLHTIAGLTNTIALISSSYFVALAVIWVRAKHYANSQKSLLIAIAIALVYVVTKLWEYKTLSQAGYSLSSNDFYMFYFMITGFHFVHVIAGIIVLALLAKSLKRNNPHSNETHQNTRLNMESGASYWHMLDLVWILLFPLIYVL